MPAWQPGQYAQRRAWLEERAELLRRELSQVRTGLERLAAGSSPERGSAVTQPAVPYRRDTAGPQYLGEAYQQILTMVSTAGRPVSGREVCAALGTGTGRNRVAAMRVKLALLVERGWLYRADYGYYLACQ